MAPLGDATQIELFLFIVAPSKVTVADSFTNKCLQCKRSITEKNAPAYCGTELKKFFDPVICRLEQTWICILADIEEFAFSWQVNKFLRVKVHLHVRFRSAFLAQMTPWQHLKLTFLMMTIMSFQLFNLQVYIYFFTVLSLYLIFYCFKFIYTFLLL